MNDLSDPLYLVDMQILMTQPLNANITIHVSDTVNYF